MKKVTDVILRQAVKAEVEGIHATATTQRRTKVLMGAVLVSSVMSMPALAGTGGDALLKDAYDTYMGAIQGYGAKLATGISGMFAMIGSVFKFQPQLIASTLGVGFTGAGVDNAVSFTVTGLLA